MSPLSVPPSVYLTWPKPNYVNPVTRGDAWVWIYIVLVVISTAVAAARLYCRIYIQKWFGWDDGLIILGVVSQMCSQGLVDDVLIFESSAAGEAQFRTDWRFPNMDGIGTLPTQVLIRPS
jgi:hypothetical protein